MNFPSFKKIPRFNREVIITEKIDGTNGLISIERHPFAAALKDTPTGFLKDVPYALVMGGPVGIDGLPEFEFHVRAGSRNRWLTPGKETDNFGFAAWVYANAEDLVRLGPGLHYGEWYGQGIQRGYGLTEKRFALFNADKWAGIELPSGVDVVPVLRRTNAARVNDSAAEALEDLTELGSVLVPGFMRPEGVIIYHTAAQAYFKVLLESDDRPKGLAA
ncbi:RNA ligase family protein [Dactylosporangium sp. CA-139066]|uniref:RNA ligase family protein n=1 Tax=Dactylosporangium sp. CA-139066 TaxID=3239930 RepID=UPI003D8E0D7A